MEGMPRWLVLLAAVSVLAAGCLSGTSDPTEPAAEPSARFDATLEECRVLISYSIIPRAVADEMASPAVEPRGNQAATGLFTFSKTCTHPSGERFSELWIALGVEPPETYPNASFVMDPVAAWTTSETMMEAYEAAGVGSVVRLGDVASDVVAESGFAWAERIEASASDADATISIAKHDPQRSDDPPGGPFYLATEGNEVVGAVNVSWPGHRGTEAWGTIQLQGKPFQAFPGAGMPAGATIQGDMHYPSTGNMTLDVEQLPPR